MKHKYLFVTTLALLLTSLLPQRILAQEQAPNRPPIDFTNCFPTPPYSLRPSGTKQQAARPQSQSSTYGGAFTPQGTLKVLVIFAGLTNDIDTRAPFFFDPNGDNPWPQTDATHPVPGTTFPKNPTKDFYDNPNSFQNTAIDHSLSNLYFQMSQHSANPFKLQAIVFPKRINVAANATHNLGAGYFKYTDDVLNALKNDPDTHNFDFSSVDQRSGTPDFGYDNSALSSDNTIDYTIIIWRNPGSVYGITPVAAAQANYGNNGWATAGYGPGFVTGIPSANGQMYQIGEGFTQANGMDGINQEVFVHEMAHTLYHSPHYLGANRVVGSYFNITEGPGMMGGFRTYFLANAWERWYNGWIELQTGANHINSDVQGAASLAATNGEFTLRDYVKTGDVVRIKLPNSSQYLWLENHQFKSALDGRTGYLFGARVPPNPLRGAPMGIIAMVEDLTGSRSTILTQAALAPTNGLKTLSAQGSFDYVVAGSLGNFNNYFWHNGTVNDDLYNFTNPVANPFGGESQITRRRIDLNGDNEIKNDLTAGNSFTVSEATKSMILNGQGEDGIFGPDAAFNTVGQKMGISYNPPIFEQQRYDNTNAKLSAIKLNGLSVELISKDATTGDITVKVRFDDVNIEQNTRWTGELQVTNVPEATAANGADVRVTSGKTLKINTTGTNNRHLIRNGDFINPTSLTCNNGSLFLQESGSSVILEGDDTDFIVNGGASVSLTPYGTTFVVKNGAVLDLKNGASFTLNYATILRVEAGGSLVIRNGATVLGEGTIEIQNGGFLCIESGAVLPTSPNSTLNVAPNAIIGTNPYLGISLGTLNCSSQLQFCGQLTGGNTVLSAICPTGNEALQFDGIDDRVTIPLDVANNNYSPIHNLGQTFTIEAAITSALTGDSQPIFSNRIKDANSLYQGMMFSIYKGNNLLFQLNEQNYFDENDPTMKVGTGCHQVAVSRDNTNHLHFYIDGQVATYSPTVVGSVHTDGPVFIGGDLGFFTTESFKGRIGEVRVWNTTRSNTDLNLYKSASLPTPQTGLVGYYDMRDPSAQDVSDLSKIYTTSSYAPNGFLGISTSVDTNDPTWVATADLTCTISGNFRQAPVGKSLQDTVGLVSHRTPVAGTSTANTKHLSQLTISPNPASGEAMMHFQLRDAGKLAVDIQDITGFARATAMPYSDLEAGAHDVQLPLRSLAPGVYLVIINSADGRNVIRLEVK